MSRRNIIFILLAGFALALGAAGAAQRDAERTDTTTTTQAPPAAAPTPGGVEANLVEGDLPADRVVRAVVGDEVQLRVASPTPDVAKIIELGVQASVGPGLPGTMRFSALSPGRFAVKLDVAGTDAGELVIEPAGEDQAEDSDP